LLERHSQWLGRLCGAQYSERRSRYREAGQQRCGESSNETSPGGRFCSTRRKHDAARHEDQERRQDREQIPRTRKKPTPK
jgi:hypothetical protein